MTHLCALWFRLSSVEQDLRFPKSLGCILLEWKPWKYIRHLPILTITTKIAVISKGKLFFGVCRVFACFNWLVTCYTDLSWRRVTLLPTFCIIIWNMSAWLNYGSSQKKNVLMVILWVTKFEMRDFSNRATLQEICLSTTIPRNSVNTHVQHWGWVRSVQCYHALNLQTACCN